MCSFLITPVIYSISLLRFAESSEDDLIENRDDKPEEEDEKLDSETTRIFTSTDILVFMFLQIFSYKFATILPRSLSLFSPNYSPCMHKSIDLVKQISLSTRTDRKYSPFTI